MSQQQLVLEADYDKFKIIPKYLKAVPRSTAIELKALDKNLIQRGQQKPIEVRRDMGILDGYTRHDLLGQRGIKIKYEFKDFPDEQSEFEYVKETNIMRRHLNPFQRVETMRDLLIHEREERRKQAGKTYIDIIISVKNGSSSTKKVAKDLSMFPSSISKTMREMTSKHYLRREQINKPTSNGGSSEYKYFLMPKSEEQLDKHKDEVRLGRIHITDIIGVHEYTISKALYLIDNADDIVLEEVRNNKVGIIDAYKQLMGKITNQKGKINNNWGKFTKIKCPNCDHVATKSEYIKV